jgi:hypothetical protein
MSNEIVDELLLLAIDPTRDDDQQQLPWLKNEVHRCHPILASKQTLVRSSMTIAKSNGSTPKNRSTDNGQVQISRLDKPF